MQGRELDGDIWDRGLGRAKAGAQNGEVWQSPGVEIGHDRLGELRLAGALMRQREQLDRDLAGGANVAALLQGVEDALVGGAREQLIAIDEVGERHRLSPQRADDMPVVDHMSALAVRDGAAAPQGRHRRHAEEAFEPVVEDAHAQAVPDQPRGRRALP